MTAAAGADRDATTRGCPCPRWLMREEAQLGVTGLSLEPWPTLSKVRDGAQTGTEDRATVARAPASPGCLRVFQIVLLKDQKKCFSIDSPGYEPEVVAVHPSGDMVAVGGTVRPFFPTPSLLGAWGIWG